MIYLVTEQILKKNTISTQSQVERLTANKANNIASKLITSKYNSQLSKQLNRLELDLTMSLNMYDYFQKALDIVPKTLTVSELTKIDYTTYQINYDNRNEPKIMDLDRILAHVKIDPNNKAVTSVEYVNRFNDIDLTEYYDARGFLSMEEMYHFDGTIANQIYYDIDYQPVLEINYVNDGTATKTYRLINYHGFDYNFDFEEQLFLFFLDEINKQQPATFIAEDPKVAFSVAAITNAKQKLAVLYENHLDAQQHLKPEYHAIVQPAYGSFDTLIVANATQAAALKQITASEISVRPLLALPFNQAVTKQNALMFVGETTPNNNLEDIYATMALIHKTLPKLELVLFTYGDDVKYRIELNRLAAKYHLNDVIHDYIYTEFRKITYDAQMFITTTKTSKFDFEVIKALAHGVPVACYQTPAEVEIVDGVNGVVANSKTPRELATKIITAYRQPDTLAMMASKAQKSVSQYRLEHFLASPWFADVKSVAKPDLSFVVPIYNVDQYLDELLASIVNQNTFYRYEVIIVDDGSTDKSLAIATAYTEKYANFKLIKQANLGPGSARNNGFKHVSGEYVAFIDGDDILASNYMDTVMGKINHRKIDVIKYAATKIKADGSAYHSNNKFSLKAGEYASGRAMFEEQIKSKQYIVTIWSCVLRVEFIKAQQITFPNVKLAEDAYFTFLACQLAKTTIALETPIYNYRVGQESLTDTYFRNELMTPELRQIHCTALKMILAQITTRKIRLTPAIRTFLVNYLLIIIVNREDVVCKNSRYHQVFQMITQYLGQIEADNLAVMLQQIM